MRCRLLILILLLSVNNICVAQNYERVMKNLEKEMKDREKYWNDKTRLTNISNPQQIHVLYISGQKKVAFTEASACKFEIGYLKLQMNRYIDAIHKEAQKTFNGAITNLNSEMNKAKRQFAIDVDKMCDCKTEKNPNYKVPMYSSKRDVKESSTKTSLNLSGIDNNDSEYFQNKPFQYSSESIIDRERQAANVINYDWVSDDVFASSNKNTINGEKDVIKPQAPVYIDLSELKVNTQQDLPVLGNIDRDIHASEKYSQTKRQIEELIKEQERLKRFCQSMELNCDAYDARIKEIDNLLSDYTKEILDFNKKERENELNKYKNLLTEYAEKYRACSDDLCRISMEGAINQTQQQIRDIEFFNATHNLSIIEAKRQKDIKSEQSQISWADKTEEIANERLKKIGEQRDELQEKLDNGTITSFEFAIKSQELSYQEQATVADILTAKTARTAINTYEYAKENKDKIINATEFVAHTGIDVIALGAAPETAGTSLLLATTAHLEISTLANMARGQDFGDAAQNAARGTIINGIKGAAINKIIPTKIVVGGSKVNVMHMNSKGQVVYQTTKRIGGNSISSSEIWDAVEIGWNLSQ